MCKKVMLYILPMVLMLFSCVLALPEEDMGPVASVPEEEPTPIPLGQATVMVVFDVPDTPTPVPPATSMPSATPTTAVSSPIAKVDAEVSYVLLYREEPFQQGQGQARRVDQIHKTLSLEQDVFRGTTFFENIH